MQFERVSFLILVLLIASHGIEVKRRKEKEAETTNGIEVQRRKEKEETTSNNFLKTTEHSWGYKTIVFTQCNEKEYLSSKDCLNYPGKVPTLDLSFNSVIFNSNTSSLHNAVLFSDNYCTDTIYQVFFEQEDCIPYVFLFHDKIDDLIGSIVTKDSEYISLIRVMTSSASN